MAGIPVWITKNASTQVLVPSIQAAASIADCQELTVKAILNKATVYKNKETGNCFSFYEPKEELTLVKGLIWVSEGLNTFLARNLNKASSIAGCHNRTTISRLKSGSSYTNSVTGKIFTFSYAKNELSLKEVSLIEDPINSPKSVQNKKEKKEASVQSLPVWVAEVGFPALLFLSVGKAAKFAGCANITVVKYRDRGSLYLDKKSGRAFHFYW